MYPPTLPILSILLFLLTLSPAHAFTEQNSTATLNTTTAFPSAANSTTNSSTALPAIIHYLIPGTPISLDIQVERDRPFLPPVDMQTAIIIALDTAYAFSRTELLRNNHLEAVFGRVRIVVEGTTSSRPSSSVLTYQVAFAAMSGLGYWMASNDLIFPVNVGVNDDDFRTGKITIMDHFRPGSVQTA
ncbi:hypothetical protein N7G274_006140 [Stereocaulon virgatum]|uniref:GerMN domain-containing protein n=1 Tax=Stereocaulon virgatum TaxID=373712 RepID=A0ABR4A5V0_9LECA